MSGVNNGFQKFLKKHHKTDHKDMKCDQCNQIIENFTELKKHTYQKHVKNLQKRAKEKCQICGKLITAQVMKRHFSDVHGKDNKPFRCDFKE